MTALGLFGIVLGLITIIFFIVKQYSIVIAAPIATLVVLLFNGMPLIDSLFGADKSYIAVLAGFIKSNFPVFLFGAILAKYMDKSGAALAIAEKVMALVGSKSPYRALVSLFIISAILTYGGINVFVVIFILIPMAKPIFKQFNLSFKLATIPIIGGTSTFTMTMLPGSPSLHNVVASNALGTPLTAAPLVGIVTSIGAIIFLLVVMKLSLNKSMKNNEVYISHGADESSSNLFDREKPSFIVSILPIATLLVIIIAFSKVNKIILIALVVSIVMSAILFRKYIDQKAILNQGATDSLG